MLFRAPAHLHFTRILGPLQRPGIAQPQPFVGRLHLPAVANLLVENPILIADAVANRRNIQRGQRIHKAGGQPPQPAVAQPPPLHPPPPPPASSCPPNPPRPSPTCFTACSVSP